jgi:hypothetical protein
MLYCHSFATPQLAVVHQSVAACCCYWQVSCKGLAGQSYDAAVAVLAAAAAEAAWCCPGLLLLDDLDLLVPAATGEGPTEQVRDQQRHSLGALACSCRL